MFHGVTTNVIVSTIDHMHANHVKRLGDSGPQKPNGGCDGYSSIKAQLILRRVSLDVLVLYLIWLSLVNLREKVSLLLLIHFCNKPFLGDDCKERSRHD